MASKAEITGKILGQARTYTPTDTLFGNQWHLSNSTPGEYDLNVTNVWDEFKGSGITIAVIDDGFDYNHSDLAPNYDIANDRDFTSYFGGDDDPSPVHSDDHHGTAVMGIIGADDNGSGVVGVAPDATLVGYRVDFNASFTSFMSSLRGAIDKAEDDNVDVVNMSLGISNFGNSDLSLYNELEGAVDNGRDGLGTILVVAGGNDRGSSPSLSYDVNYDQLSNARQTIAVGALDADGTVSSYSSPGAPLLVSAFGSPSDITTTDRTGAVGYDTSDWTSSFNGTSAAAPQVSGVAALMLDANASLTWRDVQDIMAYSAKHTGSAVGAGASGSEFYSWGFNGAENWNGGGLHYSEDYGFGRIDAHDAVRLAETWVPLNAGGTGASSEYDSATDNTIYSIPDNDTGGVSYTLNIGDNYDIDTIVLELEVTHARLVDLVIKLTSPSGTESYLLNNTSDGSGSLDWEFTSNEFRGENSQGTWTVTVIDNLGGSTGTITQTRLETWGTLRETILGNDLTDNFYIYTDEFGDYGSLSGRSTLTDISGTDILNASAITTDSTIDLREGSTSSSLAGQSLTISAGTVIEIAHGGDGHDSLIGNDADNTLNGHRGDDELEGGAGNDILNGGAGLDAASYASDTAGVTIDLNQNTGTGSAVGTDTLNDIEGGIGGSGGDTFYGNASANTFIGGAGNDLLYGFAGVDVLNGGEGSDSLDGGTGADEFYGDGGDDYLTVYADDTVVNGGAGFDSVYVWDTVGVSYNLANQALEWVQGSTTGGDTLDGSTSTVSTYQYGWGGNDNLTGGSADDFLYGHDGMDILVGGAGSDILYGGELADSLSGGAGNDYLIADGLDTLLDGGSGFDSLFVWGTTGVNLNLTTAGFEWVQGSTTGGDTLNGAANTDNSFLYGWGGNDILITGSGDDYISAGSGDDDITGGAGNDTLIGEGGADDYIFDAGWGQDTVHSFTTGTDMIDVSSISGLTSLADFGYAEWDPFGYGYDSTSLLYDGNAITLVGVQYASLSDSDFVFA